MTSSLRFLWTFHAIVTYAYVNVNRVPAASNIWNFLDQDQQLTALSESRSSCRDDQCLPGSCIEVFGRATCICPEGYRTADGKCIEKKCALPILCWPAKCIIKHDAETCFFPEGYVAKSGLFKRLKHKCQFNCLPGYCIVINDRDVCLCPPGYYSEHGFCKVLFPNEVESKCYNLDCKPGKCDKEYDLEQCLCPAGFTAKDDKCIEISLKTPGTMTTVMLMAIVAAASVILTILFAISIYYYCSQRE